MAANSAARIWTGASAGLLATFICLVVGQIAIQAGSTRIQVGAGLTIYLFAVVIVFANRGQLRILHHSTRGPFLGHSAVGFLTLMAVVTYTTALSDVPYRVDGDAAAQANNAMEFLGAVPPPLVGLGWLGRSNFYYFLDSLALRAFGPTLLGMRIFGAIGGILAILFTFLFARSVFGARTAFYASSALIVMPFHLTFARTGLESEHTVWLAPLTFWLIYLGWQRRALHLFVAGGATSGFALYFYQSALLLPFLVAAQLALLSVCERESKSHRSAIQRFAVAGAAALLGFLISYLPMIIFALQKPYEFFGRIGGTSIIASGWLDQELQSRTLGDVLTTALFRSSLPFHYQSREMADIFSTPYLTITESAAFSLGFLLLWFARLGPVWFRWFLLVYFAGGFLFLGVLTVDSPVAARYAVLLPAVAIVIGVAFDRVIEALRVCLPERVVSAILLVAISAHVLLGFSVFVSRDRRSLEHGTPADIIGTHVGRALAGNHERYHILFLDVPHLRFSSHPGLKFLAQRTGTDIPDGAACGEIAAALQPGLNYIIAPAARIDDLDAFRASGWETRTDLVQKLPNTTAAALLRIVVPEGEQPERVCPGPLGTSAVDRP